MRYIIEKKQSVEPKPSEFAVGIPNKSKKSPLPVANGEIWTMDFREHKATNKHFDFRISNGKIAYAFVIPKGLPKNNKSQNLAIRQPDHDPSDLGFEGEITKGYGKGTVKLLRYEKIYVTKSNNKHVYFATLDKYTEEYHLFKPPNKVTKDWKIQNITPKYEELDLHKEDYKSKKAKDIQPYIDDDNFVCSPKIDGAHCVIIFDDYVTHFYSPRKSKTTPNALQYTYRFSFNIIRPIKQLKGTKIRVELYFIDKKGKILPVEKISALLNKNPLDAIKQIKKEELIPQFYMFEVDKFKGKEINEPYKNKIKILNEIKKYLSSHFIIPDFAYTTKEKEELISKIERNEYPLTMEGVVFKNLNDKDAPTIKYKFGDEWDVYIREIIPTIKGGKKMMGYFTYSDAPNGKILGKVGSGFTDKERIDMLKHPKKYLGRVATIKGMYRTKAGSIRAPVFSHIRVDK